MSELIDMKWQQDEVNPEEVRIALQRVQLSESKTDDGSKIVPPVLISASRYAIQKLQAALEQSAAAIEALKAENEVLRGQVRHGYPSDHDIYTWFQESTIKHHIQPEGEHIALRTRFIVERACDWALQPQGSKEREA